MGEIKNRVSFHAFLFTTFCYKLFTNDFVYNILFSIFAWKLFFFHSKTSFMK
nr:MAG TPA: hypothetical protein [Caudoviricetes sp.]